MLEREERWKSARRSAFGTKWTGQTGPNSSVTADRLPGAERGQESPQQPRGRAGPKGARRSAALRCAGRGAPLGVSAAPARAEGAAAAARAAPCQRCAALRRVLPERTARRHRVGATCGATGQSRPCSRRLPCPAPRAGPVGSVVPSTPGC